MKKALLVLAAIGAAGYGVARYQSAAAPVPAHNAGLAQDRIWIDHMPRGERDKFHMFAMISRHSFGVFEIRSAWTGTFEGFRYEANRDEVRAVFPQNGDRETLKIDARKCNEQGMDYCLEISGNSRGVKRYVSKKEWVIDSQADVDAFAAKLAH